ncbi:hypothetical protein HN51_012742 [Arachis hypogaea]
MSYCGNSHGGDGAEIPLSDTSLLTLCGIPTKIDSDRKRTKSLVVLVEQKEKHNQHLEQTNKMSCCRSSDGRDGDEEQMSVDMVDYVVNEHHINVDSEMIKGVQIHLKIGGSSQEEISLGFMSLCLSLILGNNKLDFIPS